MSTALRDWKTASNTTAPTRFIETLPNAVLLTYPDAGHGSLFQYHESFTRHVAAFLASDSDSGAYEP